MSKESKTYKNMPKKVYIRTFGCQMNMRDAEIMLGLLQKEGYAQTNDIEQADLVLFNTCSVREHAEERVFANVRLLEKINGRPIIGIVGCMAQNYQDEILHRFPQVDLVCGPSNIYELPRAIEKVIKEKARVIGVNRTSRPLLREPGFRINKLKAFVSIMYGCNNFCSYCIVPYVRGREISRPLKHIVDEVKSLADQGCKEITLLGQNVNSYGQKTEDRRQRTDFVQLLEKLDKIKGIERIRFMTSHPKDVCRELFQAMRDLAKVCEHLHLPLQAGSDKILKLMHRGYTLDKYLKLIDGYRSIVTQGSLTSDIIVGFPGESEADFQQSYHAMQKIEFDESFIFKYSTRAKTKAARLKDDVAFSVKQRRNQDLLKLQEDICVKKNRQLLGESVAVLAEGKGRCLAQGEPSASPRGERRQMLQGRTRSYKIAFFPGEKDLIAQTVKVRINRVTAHSLIGECDDQKD